MTNPSKKQDIKAIIIILSLLICLFVAIKFIAFFLAKASIPEKDSREMPPVTQTVTAAKTK